MFESGLSWIKFLAYGQVLTIDLVLVRCDPYRATNCPIEAVDASSRRDRFLISDENNLKNKVKLLTLFGGNEIA